MSVPRERLLLPPTGVAASAGSRVYSRMPAFAHRQHVLVHQAGIEQFADHEARAAGRLELVHVGRAVGIHAASSGTTADSSAKSFQSIMMPAARATATQWIRWLVEPPVASSAAIALTMARSSTMRPIGV